MSSLLLSIFFSTVTVSFFKIFEIRKVDTFPAIVVNYFTCALAGFFVTGPTLFSGTTEVPDWWPLAMLLGGMFITIFWFIAKTSQQLGISVSMVAAKLSVIIPVAIASIVYLEPMESLKIIGIFTSLAAVYLVSRKQETQTGKLSAMILFPFVVFVGSGCIDALVNYLGRTYIPPYTESEVVTLAFLFAFLFGSGLYAIQWTRGAQTLSWKTVGWGVALGIPNFFSMYFLVKTLEGNAATLIFPINNIGIVLASTLVSVLFFQEQLSWSNRIGLILAVVSIILIGLS